MTEAREVVNVVRFGGGIQLVVDRHAPVIVRGRLDERREEAWRITLSLSEALRLAEGILGEAARIAGDRG